LGFELIARFYMYIGYICVLLRYIRFHISTFVVCK